MRYRAASEPKPIDRRRSPRFSHVSPAWITSDARPGDRQRVTATNLSQHGIAFNSPARLASGEVYCIEVGRGPDRLISEVRIVANRDDAGVFEIGAEFA